MPKHRSKQQRRAQHREVDKATRRMRRCTYCPGIFSGYKNAWKIHEARCRHRPCNNQSRIGAPFVEDQLVAAGQNLGSESNSESDSEGSEELDERLRRGTFNPDGSWDGTEANATQNEMMADLAPNNVADPDDQALNPNGIPPLEVNQIWIKRHPASKEPSGYLTLNVEHNQPSNQAIHPDDTQPPYYPFRTLDDFEQVEIFSDFGDTDTKIDRQLRLNSSTVSLKNSTEYHETLAIAIRMWGGQFTSKSYVTNFEGRSFEHYVHFQPAFPAFKKVLSDPDLAKYMVYYPEERWVHRPDTRNTPMQVLEEVWHAKLWWDLQNRIRPDQYVLYIIIYIDETNVSTIGGVHVWPVYAWIGNLPAAIRKRRTKKGGAILLGYLPKARKESNVKDLAGFRCQVYHDALNIIFESLKIPSRYGAPVRCGDGIVREFVPVVAAASADYMEMIKMICILGHRSNFPCPICLVPRLEQSQLAKSWPIRTVHDTEDILSRAETAQTALERDAILKEQSLRGVRSVFLDIIPSIHSVYSAMIADPLHQIEQGVWGKHLWPWIRDQLPAKSKDILNERFKSIPQYPDLKHFPNGITGLKYITGKEHGVILRTIAPLLEDLLRDEYQELVLSTFRALAVIHMLAKFTTHTDISLEVLEQEIWKFDQLHLRLVHTFNTLESNYPKFHSLSHLVGIIRQHGTTDNYHTGLGEALHPQSKKDYRRTNHQMNFEVQMLRMHQEREAVIRIRARIDSRNVEDKAEEKLDYNSSWDGPNVQLGSFDRNGRQAALDFVGNHVRIDPGAQKMELNLRTFLYQEVGGFGSRTHFREADLPLLDGMLVNIYRLITVGYTSILDSRLGLDVARATDSWRNQGSRHDYAIVETNREAFVARLLKVFTLMARGEKHSIAYVRHFKIGRRSKTNGYIKLTDTALQSFIFTEWITRSCVVISPGINGSTHALWDLESPDMYLRLQHM